MMTDPENNPSIPPAPNEREEAANRSNPPGHDKQGSPADLPVLTPGNLEEPNCRDDPDGDSAPGYPSCAGILRDKFNRWNPFALCMRCGHASDDPEQTVACSSEDHTDFEVLLRCHHGTDVIYSHDGALRVNIATLQRACLERLRKELAHQAFLFKYRRGNSDSVTLNSLIHQYVEMLKDYDYMKQCAQKGEKEDPFVFSALKGEDITLLSKVQKEFRNPWSASPLFGCFVSEFHEDTGAGGERAQSYQPRRNRQTRKVTNKREKVEAFAARLVMACVGGMFLIGPMILMVLNPGKLTSLLTSSICVFAFGITMATFLDKSFDVLSATAAYAAVLVVFVGTSTGSSDTKG